MDVNDNIYRILLILYMYIDFDLFFLGFDYNRSKTKV